MYSVYKVVPIDEPNKVAAQEVGHGRLGWGKVPSAPSPCTRISQSALILETSDGRSSRGINKPWTRVSCVLGDLNPGLLQSSTLWVCMYVLEGTLSSFFHSRVSPRRSVGSMDLTPRFMARLWTDCFVRCGH